MSLLTEGHFLPFLFKNRTGWRPSLLPPGAGPASGAPAQRGPFGTAPPIAMRINGDLAGITGYPVVSRMGQGNGLKFKPYQQVFVADVNKDILRTQVWGFVHLEY